jgi:hypothetical protein
MIKIILASLVMLIAYLITKILNIDDFARGLIVMWCYFATITAYDTIKSNK